MKYFSRHPLLSFLMILIFICLPSCVWTSREQFYYSLTTNKEVDNFRSPSYKTTQELLLISVKTDKFDLIGLNKIILAELGEPYTISHYLILPSQKEMLTSHIVGSIEEIQILPKGSTFRMNRLYLASHEKHFLFSKVSSYATICIWSTLCPPASKTTSIHNEDIEFELIVSLFDSLEDIESRLKKSSYSINIPYLMNNQTNAPFNISIPENHIKQAVDNMNCSYRANVSHSL